MDLNRLKATLLTSGLQQKDPTLYQVIDSLITNLKNLNSEITTLENTTSNIVNSDRQWSVLTNGDVANPELIFSNGDVIMVHIP